MYLIFDTETTGLPKNWKAPLTDLDNWPRMVQLAWQCHDIDGKFLFAKNHVIRPDGFTIPEDVVEVHGISDEVAERLGIPLQEALKDFVEDVKKSKFIIGHNISFDINIVGAELLRCEMPEMMTKAPQLCTMNESTEFCAIMKNGKPKRPTLTELHTKLFGVPFEEAHNAAADVEATSRCFLELIRVGGLTAQTLQVSDADIENFRRLNPKMIQLVGIKYESFKKKVSYDNINIDDVMPVTDIDLQPGTPGSFIHLHVHSQYSILDGASTTEQIAAKAKEDGASAIALTDHGNMFGAKEFHVACNKAGIKPIIGVEAYVAKRGHLVKESKDDGSGHHLILLAKNRTGYVNLLKLVSVANTDGFYYKPRIDKELLEKHHEGLIVSSACLGGEISQHILNGNFDKAEETALWFKNLFGDDFYLELMRHKNDDPLLKREIWENQQMVNKVLLKLGKMHNIKVIATNDAHFANEEDGEAHDLLVCLNTGRDFDDPTRMRYTKQEWLKTTPEMYEIFQDIPNVLLNTVEIANKVEAFELDKDPIMPPFDIPKDFATLEEFRDTYTEEALIEEFSEKAYQRIGGYDKVIQIKLEAEYLKHLAYIGAKKHYGEELSPEVTERLDFELDTIKTMGFPGYFLITQDFINAGKDMGVLVGPGRGSAAGSAVAYCVGITNIDPIKYDLLFERFLNPDRISMPDVDIDFDDDGRQVVLDWVTEKYGQDKVAHICTFGTMAAKSALKDVGRVLRLPLQEATRITKEFPENGKLKRAYQKIIGLEQETGNIEKAIEIIQADKKKAQKEDNGKAETMAEVQLFIANEIIKARENSDEIQLKTMENACTLEGSVRQTGVHACGILISPDPLTDHLPVMPTKDEELLTTQYDGRFVENIGLLKMDFLGLKTLSIFKECLENIKHSKGVNIDLDQIPMDDEKTYQLFANGETTAIFQFESPGMKKHLRALKPDRFEDLVAMNALYRPGPMQYIPNFIDRKHGREDVVYDHPLMEPFLKDTYGITVYQEQVMLQSRALGGFTRGDSDTLRKAMGKKIIAMMDKLKVKFTDGCLANEEFTKGAAELKKDPVDLINKIWGDWEAFAAYAFNKSHSVCYANVAYKTGYFKAHFPAEFMAANLSRNLSNITEVTKLMEECKVMRLKVFGPDVNLSFNKFTVDKNGDIRFGMAAIKGVGEAAVENIIRVREEGGEYQSIYDFMERVDLRTVNKKTIESLAQSGGFDGFKEINTRSQFFEKNEVGETFIDQLVKYGNQMKADKASTSLSLFDSLGEDIEVAKPNIPKAEPWSTIEELNAEKELVGIYLSAHPLDDYKLEITKYCKSTTADLLDLEDKNGQEISLGGIVTGVRSGMTKTNRPFGGITLEDYAGTTELMFFGKDYLNFKNYCTIGYTLFIKGLVKEKGWGNNPNEKQFNVNTIEMLGDLRERIKGITLKVGIHDITDHMMDELLSKIEANKGESYMKFLVFDPKNTKVWIRLLSRIQRVGITNEFIHYLDNHPFLEYQLE